MELRKKLLQGEVCTPHLCVQRIKAIVIRYESL